MVARSFAQRNRAIVAPDRYNSAIHGGKGFALLRHLLAGLCTIRKLKRKFSVLENYLSTTF